MTKNRKLRARKPLLRRHWESIAQNWQLWVLLILVGASIYGAALLTAGSLARTAEIPRWPTIPAVIKEVKITQTSPLEPITAELELAYQVAKENYISFYQRSWVPQASQPHPSQWKVGQTIDIRYQPSNPQIISLHPAGP